MTKENHKGDVYIRMKNGGGFWVDKDEYESSYAGAVGVETGEPEIESFRERHLRYNEQERIRLNKVQKEIDELLRRDTKGREIQRKLKEINNKIAKLSKYQKEFGKNDNIQDLLKKFRELKKRLEEE